MAAFRIWNPRTAGSAATSHEQAPSLTKGRRVPLRVVLAPLLIAGVGIAATLIHGGWLHANAASYATTITGDSPAFYYRLDEASGTTMVDSSGNGRNATYQSGLTYAIRGALAGDSDTAIAPNGNIADVYSFSSGEPLGELAS